MDHPIDSPYAIPIRMNQVISGGYSIDADNNPLLQFIKYAPGNAVSFAGSIIHFR